MSGYNNPAIKSALTHPSALLSLINRPALAMHPPLDNADRIRAALLSIAPAGLDKVSTMMCGTCSNENAFKAAFIKYMVGAVIVQYCIILIIDILVMSLSSLE